MICDSRFSVGVIVLVGILGSNSFLAEEAAAETWTDSSGNPLDSFATNLNAEAEAGHDDRLHSLEAGLLE